jgi:hypothetical protein
MSHDPDAICKCGDCLDREERNELQSEVAELQEVVRTTEEALAKEREERSATKEADQERDAVVEALVEAVRDAYKNPLGNVSPTGLRAPTRMQLAVVDQALRIWDQRKAVP